MAQLGATVVISTLVLDSQRAEIMEHTDIVAFASANGITTGQAEQVIAGNAPLVATTPILLTGMVSGVVHKQYGEWHYREAWDAPWADSIAALPPRSLFDHNDAFPEFRHQFIAAMRGFYDEIHREVIADGNPDFMPKDDPGVLSDDEFIERIYAGEGDWDDPVLCDPDLGEEWTTALERLLVAKEPQFEGGCVGPSVCVPLPESMAGASAADLRAHLDRSAPGAAAVRALAGVDPDLLPVQIPPSPERDFLGPFTWVDPASEEHAAYAGALHM